MGGSTVSRLDDIRSGDERELGLLLDEAWAPLVAYLQTLVDSPEAAQDAAQEAFVRLWERREQWEDGSARGLLFRIGRNAALDALRRRRVRRRWMRAERPGAEHPGGEASPPTPDQELVTSELGRRLADALATLAPRRREVFELVRFRGFTYREIGQVLGISPQTVANHMTLAQRELRELLADVLGPDEGAAGFEPRTRSHDA